MRQGVRVAPVALFALVTSTVGVAACGSSKSAASPDADVDAGGDTLAPPRTVTPGNARWEKPGPYSVGHATFTATDAARARTLRFEVWYPSDAPAGGTTLLADLEPDGGYHDAVASLALSAPAACARTTTGSVDGTPPHAPATPAPFVVFSHCHSGTRWEMFTVAERLASQGIRVIAPDHLGDTLWEHLQGHDAALDAAMLATRVADVRFAADVALDASDKGPVPAQLRGGFDATRLGVIGHSFGAVTVGATLAKDARFLSGFAIAAPFDALGGVDPKAIHRPVFFLLAQEDNSISEIGNNLIRHDFKDGNAPLWLAEVADAGHWSFADLCGLDPAFGAGCGVAVRQTNPPEMVSYLDNAGARGLAASYAAAFFDATLRGDADAKAFVGGAHPEGIVTVSAR